MPPLGQNDECLAWHQFPLSGRSRQKPFLVLSSICSQPRVTDASSEPQAAAALWQSLPALVAGWPCFSSVFLNIAQNHFIRGSPSGIGQSRMCCHIFERPQILQTFPVSLEEYIAFVDAALTNLRNKPDHCLMPLTMNSVYRLTSFYSHFYNL